MPTADPRPDDPALRDMAHGVLDANRYLVLGTAERDGRPRVSPVYFTHDRYREIYWVSSPGSTHSGNVGEGARAFTPEELPGDADLRLYRATVETAQVHVRGSHPQWGSGIDRRVTVRLG